MKQTPGDPMYPGADDTRICDPTTGAVEVDEESTAESLTTRAYLKCALCYSHEVFWTPGLTSGYGIWYDATGKGVASHTFGTSSTVQEVICVENRKKRYSVDFNQEKCAPWRHDNCVPGTCPEVP